jgi:hypothetical protein
MERFRKFSEMFTNFPTLQKDLSLLDKPAPKGEQNVIGPMALKADLRAGPPPRAPPNRSDTLPQQRPDGPLRPPRGPNSPSKRPPHQRRASESSVMEKDKLERRDRRERDGEQRPPRTESEERRRRERRKEREERYKREGRDRNGRRLKPQRNLDLIDKLDVTGIYGQGREWSFIF